MVVHHRVHSLAGVHHHHGLLAALHRLRLVLVGVLEQLQPVADLALVEAVGAVCWLRRACNGLLGRPGGGLIGAVAALGAIKGALLVIIGLNAAWLLRVHLWNVACAGLLLLLDMLGYIHVV